MADPDSDAIVNEFVARERDLIRGARILEVGSQDVNGEIRSRFKGPAEYVGVDAVAGKGVDVVMKDQNALPFPDGRFDMIVTANAIEHMRQPWTVAKEMARVLRPGGWLFAVVPWNLHVHKDARCPLDCWRILPDGMRALLEWAGLVVARIESKGVQTAGWATKPAEAAR